MASRNYERGEIQFPDPPQHTGIFAARIILTEPSHNSLFELSKKLFPNLNFTSQSKITQGATLGKPLRLPTTNQGELIDSAATPGLSYKLSTWKRNFRTINCSPFFNLEVRKALKPNPKNGLFKQAVIANITLGERGDLPRKLYEYQDLVHQPIQPYLHMPIAESMDQVSRFAVVPDRVFFNHPGEPQFQITIGGASLVQLRNSSL